MANALNLIYRAASGLAGPILRLAAPFRPNLANRMALDIAPVQGGGIWLHAASVGELASARTILSALPGPVIVTTNSVTGREAARKAGFDARLAPLDMPGALARFLDATRPRAAVTIENEIWPNRSAALATRGIPQVVLGARLSARSAARWGKARGLIAPVLARIHALSAQDRATEARLLALGLPPSALLPRVQLKLLAPAAITPASQPGRATCWLAASTHEGEEEAILDAHLRARAVHTGLRLILAPRHPDRGPAIAAMIEARGLDFARRSEGAETAGVLLADTLGEMPLWYDRASVCFTGGSLNARGGHTPWEPAAHRCAILHGPDIGNFLEDYAALAQAGAAQQVTAQNLGDAVAALTGSAQAETMGQAARDTLLARAGDPAPLIAAILRARDGAPI